MKVAVIGSGVMGPGIAQTWLTAGHEVALADISRESLEEGKARIRESVNQMHERKLLEKGADLYLPLLTATTSLPEAVGNASLVIECVAERPDVKQAVYNELDRLCPPDAVVVSNTSALPLPDMFPDFRPDRFFICHYFNPPEIIPVVELVKGARTDQRVVDWLKGKLEGCGKKTIALKGYKMGFLVNRIQTAMMREALYLVESGIIDPEDVDTAVTACVGFKSAWQGLFDTMDYIGLDTVSLACGVIYPDLDNSASVPEIITRKVREGSLGVKTGKGFYDYTGEEGAGVLKKRREVLLDQLALWKKANTE